MCRNGCLVDPVTKRCRSCGKTLKQIMDHLKVPAEDQEHTLNMLVYKQFQ